MNWYWEKVQQEREDKVRTDLEIERITQIEEESEVKYERRMVK